MAKCYKCDQDIVVIERRIGRLETCSSCGTSLHCCRNCEFYDMGHYNECREPVSDRIVDKEKANFCDLYKIAETPYREADKSAAAKKSLEDLFKKK